MRSVCTLCADGVYCITTYPRADIRIASAGSCRDESGCENRTQYDVARFIVAHKCTPQASSGHLNRRESFSFCRARACSQNMMCVASALTCLWTPRTLKYVIPIKQTRALRMHMCIHTQANPNVSVEAMRIQHIIQDISQSGDMCRSVSNPRLTDSEFSHISRLKAQHFA